MKRVTTRNPEKWIRGAAGTAGVVLLAGGCGTTTQSSPAGPRGAGGDGPGRTLPSGQDVQPQFESQRTEMRPGEGMGDIQPTLILQAEDLTLVFQLPSPALVEVRRVEGEEGVTVASAEGRQGQVVVVDRREGVRLGGQELQAGPLQRGATYELYVLPPGGVRHEVTRTTVRPPTLEEIEAAREARLEREAAERRVTTRRSMGDAPTTGPSP